MGKWYIDKDLAITGFAVGTGLGLVGFVLFIMFVVLN